MSHEVSETVELPNGMWAVVATKKGRKKNILGGPFKTLNQANAWAQWRSNPKGKNLGERPTHKQKPKEYTFKNTFEYSVKRNLENAITGKRAKSKNLSQKEKDELAQEQRRLMAARMVLENPVKGTILAGVGGTINEGNKLRREAFLIPGIDQPYAETRSKPSIKNLMSWYEGILDALVTIEKINKRKKKKRANP